MCFPGGAPSPSIVTAIRRSTAALEGMLPAAVRAREAVPGELAERDVGGRRRLGHFGQQVADQPRHGVFGLDGLTVSVQER
jgi:hypothetical protein